LPFAFTVGRDDRAGESDGERRTFFRASAVHRLPFAFSVGRNDRAGESDGERSSESQPFAVCRSRLPFSVCRSRSPSAVTIAPRSPTANGWR